MTTLLVVIIVLVVISLALDVLILATMGNLLALLVSPKKTPVAVTVNERSVSVSRDAIQTAINEAVVRSHYDA